MIPLFLGTLFTYCVVPETKGKNADEIRAIFANVPISMQRLGTTDPNNNTKLTHSDKTLSQI